jgi:hypothetical protein
MQDGRTVAGAHVLLHRASPQDAQIGLSDFPTDTVPDAVASAVSDSRGEFCLDLQCDGDFMVRAESERLGARHARAAANFAADGQTGIELVLSSGGSLAGQCCCQRGCAPRRPSSPSRAAIASRRRRASRPSAPIASIISRRRLADRGTRRGDRAPAATLVSRGTDTAAPPRWRCTVVDGRHHQSGSRVPSLSSCELRGGCASSRRDRCCGRRALRDERTLAQRRTGDRRSRRRFRLKARHGGPHDLVLSTKIGDSHVEIRESMSLRRGDAPGRTP